MVVLAVTWVASPGQEEAVAAILEELARLSQAEPGCIQYDVHRDPDDPTRFFLWERYRDQAAFDEHSSSPHFQELVLGKAIPLLAERERVFLTPLGA